MEAPKKETPPKVYKAVDRHGMIYLFMPSPRKTRGTRGHNPLCRYAEFRSPMREARREVQWPSGRQWVKFRKFGLKAYRKHVALQTDRGINATK